jgi:UDP-N-acetylglucosamine--N-acetylmuramyl-(pentapeptide) pyrophosphoryl-undecaprenol N-acetylglucosamine transferase
MVTIAFTGGGTGGHIYPGLAVIARLRERLSPEAAKIFWIGSGKGMDRSLVEGAAAEFRVEFFGVPAGRLRRYFSLKTIPDMWRVAAGFFAARKILKKQKVDLLFSKGGFVSVPPCAAAASLGIPVFTHESDFSPGLATRINLRFVARTGGRLFTAYKDTAAFFPPAFRDRALSCGNPVRPEFRASCQDGGNSAGRGRAFLGLAENERILLVLGGSQGAQEINDLVRDCLAELTEYYTVVHQTGEKHSGAERAYRYLPYPYIKDEMPDVLAAAELILGRSGAGTVWESAAAGKPMALIPLSGSGTRGDQVENARFFEKAGAAVVLAGAGVNAESLAQTVASIAQDEAKRKRMASAAEEIGKTDGAAFIADSICEFIGVAPCSKSQ